MKVCSNCGTECENNAEICPVCKTGLNEKPADNKPYAETFDKYNTKHFHSSEQASNVENRFFKKNPKLLILLAIILFVIVIAIVVIASYTPKSNVLDGRNVLSVFTIEDEAAEGAVILQGLSNADGEMILGAEYQKILAEIEDGIFAVIGSNSKIGAVNKNGKETVPCQFLDCNKYGFRDGLWAVFDGERWGYINKKGEYKIPSDYQKAEAFSDGLAAVCINDKWGYINKKGKAVIPCSYDEAEMFIDGLARVCINGRYGFIDKKGEMVIDAVYDYAYPCFSDGLCLVKYGNRFGYIDASGEWIINPQFDGALPFSEGLAAVSLEGSVGYIDKAGKYVIKPQYINLSGEYMFFDGLAAVKTNEGASIIIDKSGKQISDKYTSYSYADARFDGFILVRSDEKYGLLNDNCSAYIYEPTYTDYITAYRDTVVFYDEVQEKYIYINAKGKVINSTKNSVSKASITSYSMDIKDIILNNYLAAN